MPSAVAPAFAAAHRVGMRVHGLAAHMRTPAHVPLPPRLANRNVLVIEIPQLTDGCPAFDAHLPHFARRQQDRVHEREDEAHRDRLLELLREGEPSVALSAGGSSGLYGNPQTLQPGEELTIIRRVREILRDAVARGQD